MNQSVSPDILSKLAEIVGDSQLLFDDAVPDTYLQEQRGQFSSQCLAVARPGNTEQVRDCVRLCVDSGVSIVPMGGNTGLCGGAVATAGQVIISLERLNQVRQVDTDNNSITVEAGCILADVQQTAERHDRLFPLSLGAEGSCQIGGNLSTNAGGINVLHYGNTRELCLGIEAVLPNGTIYSDLGGLRKDNTGYSLKHLLIGAEGTLGIITAATLKLFPQPKETVTALVALQGLDEVIQLYNLVREASSDRVTTFELIPQIAVEYTARHFSDQPPPFDHPHPWLVLVTLHSSSPEPELQERFANALAGAHEQGLVSDALIAQSIAQANYFLALREKLVAAQKFEGVSIKHDVSVPVSAIPEFIRRAASAVEATVPGARPYPFGHVGDGNIHYNISQPTAAESTLFQESRQDLHDAVLDIVYDLGGSFSAEHGVGILKTDLIPRYKGDVALAAMRSIKRAIDPQNIMNPGKVVGD